MATRSHSRVHIPRAARWPRLVPGLAIGGLALVLATGPARAQTAQFSAFSYKVGEPQPQVIVTLTVSGPSEFWVGVLVETADGTAIDGSDYTHTSDFVSWLPGDDTPKEFTVPILNDELPEDMESFSVNIIAADGIDIGEPSTANVFIFDDDEGIPLTAYLDVVGVIPDGNGDHNLVGNQGETIPVTIKLNQIPPNPVTVQYSSEFPPGDGEVVFDGTDAATIMVTGPTPGSGQHLEVGAFSIVGIPPARPRAGGFPFSAWINFLDPEVGELCVWCGVNQILGRFDIMGCPPECGEFGVCVPGPHRAERRSGVERAYDVLTRYRDEILDTTNVGRFYMDQYTTWSRAIGEAVLRSPTFIYRVFWAHLPWVDGLSALVNGNGGTTVITPEMQAGMREILDHLEAEGSPELVQAVERERFRLRLDNIEGLSMDQFQERVETFGGVPVVESSWGQVKDRYR